MGGARLKVGPWAHEGSKFPSTPARCAFFCFPAQIRHLWPHHISRQCVHRLHPGVCLDHSFFLWGRPLPDIWPTSANALSYGAAVSHTRCKTRCVCCRTSDVSPTLLLADAPPSAPPHRCNFSCGWARTSLTPSRRCPTRSSRRALLQALAPSPTSLTGWMGMSSPQQLYPSSTIHPARSIQVCGAAYCCGNAGGDQSVSLHTLRRRSGKRACAK